ncbi:uncharacterized protein LAESUDRAFT_727030, partial [Laetiporus sulphureus 93-53]
MDGSFPKVDIVTLYAKALTDITSGESPGCGINSFSSSHSFYRPPASAPGVERAPVCCRFV